MTTDDLPCFPFHRDPDASGSLRESDDACQCCAQARGILYDGIVYSTSKVDSLCPWCIADGSAHEELGAGFTDEVGIGGGGTWEEVPEEVVQEVAYRTPGFCGWQQEKWWTHCGDAAQFIGRAGRDELETLGPQAIASIQDSAGLSDGPAWDQFFAALDKEGSPTAYIFRCTKCGQLGGYQDCD